MAEPLSAEDLYRPPSAEEPLEDLPDEDGEAERVRERHLKREAAVRAIGRLSSIVWLLWTGFAIVGFFIFTRMATKAPVLGAIGIAPMLIWLAIVGTGTTGAILLARLHPAGRIIHTIFSVLILIAWLVGLSVGRNPSTLQVIPNLLMQGLNVAFLITLWSAPSGTVFSHRYRHEIIPATSHLKARMPWWYWTLIALGLASIIIPLGSWLLMV